MVFMYFLGWIPYQSVPIHPNCHQVACSWSLSCMILGHWHAGYWVWFEPLAVQSGYSSFKLSQTSSCHAAKDDVGMLACRKVICWWPKLRVYAFLQLIFCAKILLQKYVENFIKNTLLKTIMASLLRFSTRELTRWLSNPGFFRCSFKFTKKNAIIISNPHQKKGKEITSPCCFGSQSLPFSIGSWGPWPPQDADGSHTTGRVQATSMWTQWEAWSRCRNCSSKSSTLCRKNSKSWERLMFCFKKNDPD